jgi:dihydroorotase
MAEAKRLGKIIVSHCRRMPAHRRLHPRREYPAPWPRGISSESEWGQIRRDIELVRQTGADYHICHMSAKESVELLRQPSRGIARHRRDRSPLSGLHDMDIARTAL